MNEIKIMDLYAGKPDAKDEVDFEGLKEFVKTFVVSENVNISGLVDKNQCFITGFKGTGKTALLFYLDDYVKKIDESTCSSFIFFKEEFTDVRRCELGAMSERIMSSVYIEQDALVEQNDFEYIWRWLLFKRIVADNELYNNQLFVDNEEWHNFKKSIDRIKEPSDKKKSIIPKSIRLLIPYQDAISQTFIASELEVHLRDKDNDDYIKFIEIIDECERLFSALKRTDIPYYIFIDELEAYYGEEKVFKRDLSLIRDLIFTVKRFNAIMASTQMRKTKIICSVRSEILNAISRYVVTKELNKVTSGFSVPLTWNYSNTNSYAHPIIQIILKRIAYCEGNDMQHIDYKDIYQRWFPEKIHNIEPASYLLNNSWCKPRDMVRFLTVTQSGMHSKATAFSQTVIAGIVKAYSEDSLQEIREELRALYDTRQIELIITCFTGYKTHFSMKQLKQRIEQYFSGTILETDMLQILNDLYRLGFLGNFLPASRSYRWQHKGDEGLILTEEWRMAIHYALHSALSMNSRQNFGLNRGEEPEVGDVAIATVIKVMRSHAMVEFKHYGEIYSGNIHIGEFGKKVNAYIPNLRKIVAIDDEIKVVIGGYNSEYKNWNLLLADDEEQESGMA